MKLMVTLAALVLTGTAVSGDTADEEEDVGSLRIDIGRLGVINDHTREIWLKMRSDRSEYRTDDLKQLSSSLRQLVWEYNDLREQLCNDRFMVEQSCGPPYLPTWINESPKDIPSPKQLQARQGELEDRVVPLWDAACERLNKATRNGDSPEFCSVE